MFTNCACTRAGFSYEALYSVIVPSVRIVEAISSRVQSMLPVSRFQIRSSG